MMHPKPFKVRSSVLTKSADGEMCTLRLPQICIFGPQTVVLCHLPGHAHGLGTKEDDSHAVYGCQACHDTIDGRANQSFSRTHGAIILDAMLRALSETHHRMIAAGLIQIQGWEP